MEVTNTSKSSKSTWTLCFSFRQNDPKLLAITKNVQDFFDSLAPNNLVSVLALYDITFKKIITNVFGIDTYLEKSSQLIEAVKEECKRGQADAEGNYIDR